MKTTARIPLAFCAGLALAAAAPTMVCVPAVAQEAVAVSSAVASGQSAGYTSEILVKVNELRASLGLTPVTRYTQLDAVAQEWSEHMSSTRQFVHRDLGAGGFPAGYSRISENIAMRSGAPGEDVGAKIFNQWLTSTGHYENMTAPNVNSIGIGVTYNASTGTWYATQNFAAYADPAGAGLTPTDAATTPVPEKPTTPAPAPSQDGKPTPAPESTVKQSVAPTPAETPTTTAPKPSSAPSTEPTMRASVTPSASAVPTTASTPKRATATTKAERQVIALPTPGESGRASSPATPGVTVAAAPEHARSVSNTSALPMTGVSLGSALVSLGLAGVGVTSFAMRARRRA
ncbi:CAP domain-containing protein [Actinomyces trachealis]|uniref:CAP domain-containing protein n=1 Tax=Actinomyces trachealis TaxID=2763540 RepID=UPI0018928AAC|nr:CAP domain-containing protein [Actinomyces trachealis]